jgi:Flp pilus assembly protein TadD
MLRELSQQEAALESLQAFLGAHPNASWEVLSLQGILFDERGKYAEAETSHRAALALDTNRSALHNNLGYNLTLQGKRDLAIAEFHRALELDANSEYAKNNLAVLEAMNGKAIDGQSVNLWKRVSSTLGKAVLGPPDGAKK